MYIKNIINEILPSTIYEALRKNPAVRVKKTRDWRSENGEYYINAVKNGRSVFLLNTPTHTNVGDLAIAAAEMDFLSDAASGRFIEVPAVSNNKYGLDALKKIIPNDAVICYHGGGYIGSDWKSEDEAFRRAVGIFSDNRLIMFPQSVFFADNDTGRAALKNSVRDLSKHNDLHLFAREPVSFELMRQYYKNANIYLAPDMAFILNYAPAVNKRDGILLTLRSDREKSLSVAETAYIKNVCEKYGASEFTDMITTSDKHAGADMRNRLVTNKLGQIEKASLVVTDRLHGMIFSFITGTPCVAVKNSNHKIKGAAEWISDCGYVRYVEDLDKLDDAVKNVLTCGPGIYDRNNYLNYYDALAALIKEKL